MTDLITSASNPVAKRIRSLKDRKGRKQERAFLVEGMQPVWRAAESGWKIDMLIVAPDLVGNNAVYEMADQLQDTGTRIVHLSAGLFTRLSERDGPAGVMAIVDIQHLTLDDVIVGDSDVWLILHRIHNPGNLGTIIRTADAAGISGVILCGDHTDPFAPAAVKSTMGSLFSMPLVIESSVDAVLNWAAARGVHLVGTSGYASTDHWNADIPRPMGLLLGNEGDGLPDELLQRTDSAVRIPMTGTAESLNLSIAAALLMYEVQRNKID